MPKDRDDIWLRRPTPAVEPDLASFDGERYLTGITGEIEAEHVHRYLFACGLCAGKDVLDIACGEGYGSAMLARVSQSVVGVDIDGPTIEHARRAYADSGVEFEPGDCTEIPYKANSFDVVVSFETIEHIEQHAAFLREMRRVLRPGGLLICSTPDAGVYRHPDGQNPFHAKELTRDEYDRLLTKRFKNVRILGQRLVSGSVITRGESAKSDLINTEDGGAFRKSGASDGAPYLIAVCSDERLPRIDSSLLNDHRYSIGRHTGLLERQRALLAQAADAEERRRMARADADAAHYLTQEKTAAIETMQREIDRHDRSLREANTDIATLREQAARLSTERDAAASERDIAIRDAAGAHVELGRIQDELERVRTEMIEAREKAASAQASAAASEAERETLREAARVAIEERDTARTAETEAQIEAARIAERLRVITQDRDDAKRREQDLRRSLPVQIRAARQEVRDTLTPRLEEAQREARQSRARLADAEQEIARLTGSRSWRWTAPIRAGAGLVRTAAGGAMGLGGVVLGALRLPGAERLAVERRAAIIRRSGYFNPEWYLARYPGVARAGIDPARHFAARGSIERRDPSPKFSTAHYLDSNPDVAASGVHALEHFITKGLREGRTPLPAPKAPATGAMTAALEPSTSHDIAIISEPAPIDMPEVDPERLARTKAIAFFLPQFHPIPENDAWWGKGFTEWSNVTRARPMYPGHAQPVLPGELGFYDLRLPEIRERQAELARSAGIHGFCYYHYWFNGRRVLERPLDEIVQMGSPDFPFCVCWANENWTRRWDGMEQEILLRQQHSLASDRRFITDLLPYLEDERYIRVDGKPVVLVYRPDLMHDASDTAAVWRDECRRAGIGDLHLCAVQFRTSDPRPLGFDAAVEFPPHHFPAPEITKRVPGLTHGFEGVITDYRAGVESLIARPPQPEYRLHRGVMPSWDNTARRLHAATIHHGATPELYEAWLRSAINHRRPGPPDAEQLVFINAWNEWAEGTVLEPRRDIGDAYLRATARALNGPLTSAQNRGEQPAVNAPVHAPSVNGSAAARPAVGSVIETKLKRAVRTSPALNAFVNRHPDLKNRAAGLVRKVSAAERPNHASPGANGTTPAKAVTWRGTPVKTNESAPKLLVVSHDAALAGAQLIVLENVRHWAGSGVDCRVLLLGSGPLETRFAEHCPTACIDDLGNLNRSRAVRVVLDDLGNRGWTPDAAFCNTVAAVDAADELRRRRIPVTSAVYELPTSIDDALGGRRTIERVMSSSRRVIVASAFVRDRLASAYGINPDRLEPAHTGVLARDLPERSDARAAIRRELGVPDDTAVVLGCGSIHHRKGTDLFVAAAAETMRLSTERQRPRPTVFVWVGEDQSGATFGNWCRHDAERLGVTGTVRFVGADPNPARWFAGADMFALTSREDPYPMVNLEAINAGLPVIAFEGGGGAPEILNPNTIGATVPYADARAFGDAIDRMIEYTDDAERERIRCFARDSLGWPAYMDQLNERLASCSPRFASLVSESVTP